MRKGKVTWRFWIGLTLIAVAWPLNWGLGGFRTHALFFPLWLGYVFLADGLTYWRTGSSLLARSRWRILWLFALSIPVWWLFEAFNLRTQNWRYVGSRELEGFAYAFWASLNFSTVIPAVFASAELVASFGERRWSVLAEGRKSKTTKRKGLRHPMRFVVLGVAMLAALLVAPDYAYPFMWLSVFFIIDPINAVGGRPSLLAQMAAGRWRNALVLGIAALICGFFWELWNVYSDPKWVYRIPVLGFWKVFEMPLLGYGGYVPFAWELYALYQLVRGRIGAPKLRWDAKGYAGGSRG